jgi:hypothetical protein
MAKKSQLRGLFGGEQFSHQIVRARTYTRANPEWAQSDKGIAGVIERAFPKWKTTQIEAASRWAAIIHLYFRMGFTRSQIAAEIGSTTQKVHCTIRSIYRVSKGLNAAKGSIRGRRGRPPKIRSLDSRGFLETPQSP